VTLPPSFRIAALIAFAAACATVGPAAVAGLALLAVAANLPVAGALAALGALLWRTRWLLVMVVMLNAFATPGPAAWGGAPDWMPSAAGLTLALHRGATLVAMLAAVNLLMRTTPTVALVAGIADLARPLRPLGVASDRIGARLAGALVELAATETALRARASAGGWLDAVAERVLAIESRAGR
jgi:energy-coupling factor transporter transmembrane protein EcfT